MKKYRLIGRAPINIISGKEATDEVLDFFGCFIKSEPFYASDSYKAFDMLDIWYPDTWSRYIWNLEEAF